MMKTIGMILGGGLVWLLLGCATQSATTATKTPFKPYPNETPVLYSGPAPDSDSLSADKEQLKKQGMTEEQAEIQARADFLKTHSSLTTNPPGDP